MTEPAPTYRVLRPDDARLLAGLHAEVFDAPWSPAAFRAELSKPSIFALGLVDDETVQNILSFVIFQRALDEAEMLTLATAPKRQRSGWAQLLLKTAFEHLTARGVTRILLDVAVDNTAAIGLYQKLGFVQDGLRKAYYKRSPQTAVDACLMSKDMTGLRR